MTDLHALIYRMADELDLHHQHVQDDRTARHSLAAEARATLSQPAPEGLPTTRLALHPDGTPMISIGEAVDLRETGRLAADPEHSRACLIRQHRKAIAVLVQGLKDSGCWGAMEYISLPRPDGPLNKSDLERIWQEEQDDG